MSNPKRQGNKSGGSYVENQSCAMHGKNHEGKCLVFTGNCYGYGKGCHMKRDFPMLKVEGR